MNLRPHTEEAFDMVIEAPLRNDGDLAVDRPGSDAERAVFPGVVLDFIRQTQCKEWGKLEALHGARTGELVLTDLCKWMDKHGWRPR
jgi:type I restriction enzyme R subunit